MTRWLAVAILVTMFAGCFGNASSPPTGLQGGDPDSGIPAFSNTSVFPGDYTAEGMPRPVEPGPFDPLVAEVVDLRSEVDDATIRIGLIRPDVPATDEVPVIVIASPYFTPMVATAEEDNNLNDRVDEELGPFDDWFVPHGYAVAAVTVRGTTGSGGCFEYMGEKEQADVNQAVTWLGSQPWSNNNVGMIGLSYDGSTPWMVAAAGNPYLKTIVPVSGVNDPFDLFFRNGTPQERGLWHPVYYWGTSGIASSAQAGSLEGLADNVACTAPVEATAAAAQAFHTGERNDFYDARNLRPGVEDNYRGSVLAVIGLQDWNVVPGHQVPWINHLEAQDVVVKQLLGQWGHTYPHIAGTNARQDFPEILLHWWDYWLMDEVARDLGPRVQVQDDAGRWRNEAAWPPLDAARAQLFLTPDGLSDEPATVEQSVVVTASPAHLAVAPGPETVGLQDACAACVVLASQPLEQEMLLSGFPRLHIDVTPVGTGAYINAYLYADDGTDAHRVGWGSVDLRFGHGGSDPQTITSGVRMPLGLELEPLDAVVSPGDRFVLVIAQGSYGVDEPGRATTWELSPAATQPLQVHIGGERAWLELPIIDRAPSAYFDAP